MAKVFWVVVMGLAGALVGGLAGCAGDVADGAGGEEEARLAPAGPVLALGDVPTAFRSGSVFGGGGGRVVEVGVANPGGAAMYIDRVEYRVLDGEVVLDRGTTRVGRGLAGFDAMTVDVPVGSSITDDSVPSISISASRPGCSAVCWRGADAPS
ncbi:MAG: hypothetical protein AAF078_13360, partial [Planctomycetota bacterium]